MCVCESRRETGHRGRHSGVQEVFEIIVQARESESEMFGLHLVLEIITERNRERESERCLVVNREVCVCMHIQCGKGREWVENACWANTLPSYSKRHIRFLPAVQETRRHCLLELLVFIIVCTKMDGWEEKRVCGVCPLSLSLSLSLSPELA